MPTNKKKRPTKEDIERKKLTDYIQHLGGENIDWVYTMSRVKQFTKQGMTYAGMRYALWYQVNIQQTSYSGIEFIPYLYDKAKRYWADMQRVKQSIANATFGKSCITIEKQEHDEKEDIFI